MQLGTRLLPDVGGRGWMPMLGNANDAHLQKDFHSCKKNNNTDNPAVNIIILKTFTLFSRRSVV